MKIDGWIAETTDCDFKVAVEAKKPKSWLKSVSAFANGIGGTLFFGVDNDRNVVGLSNVQSDAEVVSHYIKERITPFPIFNLSAEQTDGKDILVLAVNAGFSTPYYYKADGIKEAYIRIGNESIVASDIVLNRLILKGINSTYDSLYQGYDFKDYSFSKLKERYKVWTGNSMDDKLFESFELRDGHGKLTNAGALLADDSPVRHSRLFCTRWNGLDKSGGVVDALDSAEYSGSLIILLNEGISFIKRNMKTSWKKTATSRIEMPDYCERSFFEAIVNALIHRDYLVQGSEVHIDIYDDRLTISSPGGMVDGTYIQERDLSTVSSTRRNPILADIFGRLGYMERQGSGFEKITGAYHAAQNFRAELEPKFYSSAVDFQVTLFNLNYRAASAEVVKAEVVTSDPEKVAIDPEKVAIDPEKVAIDPEKVAIDPEKAAIDTEKAAFEAEKVAFEKKKAAFERALFRIKVSTPTRDKVMGLFKKFEYEGVFSRSDIVHMFNIASSSAGDIIYKLKLAGLIEPVSGYGKGKYKFAEQSLDEAVQ